MQGIRATITAERTLGFETFEVPDRAGEGELLLQMKRSIVSAGTELANYTGLEPQTRVPGSWCCYPWRPGYGGIGQVIDAGPGAGGFQKGDHVYGILPHATHGTINTRRQVAVKIPEGSDLTQAVFTRMASVAITGYNRADVRLGDTVIIIGLGLVGNLCGQFFAMNGLTTLGLDPVQHRRELAEKSGFTATFDSSASDLKENLDRLSHGRGVQVAIDAVGQSPLVMQAIDLVARHGQVILLGSPRADYTGEWTPTMSKIHLQGLDVKGALEWIYPLLPDVHAPMSNTPISVQGNSEKILEYIQSGRMKVDDLLTHLIEPNELQDAYEGLLLRKNDYLGVVVDWTKPVQEADPRTATS